MSREAIRGSDENLWPNNRESKSGKEEVNGIRSAEVPAFLKGLEGLSISRGELVLNVTDSEKLKEIAEISKERLDEVEGLRELFRSDDHLKKSLSSNKAEAELILRDVLGYLKYQQQILSIVLNEANRRIDSQK